MKITRITSHVLGYDLPETLGYSQQYYTKRTAHLVEVETDENTPLLIDTNQLLEMFFAVGEMGDVHQQFLLFFTGGLTIQDQAPDMSKSGIEYLFLKRISPIYCPWSKILGAF